MGAKITLTGTRASKLRKTAQYYSFDMELSGSKNGPKGCPAPSENIQYTVFVSIKAGNKANLSQAPEDQKWMIQGELALDISVDKCPGEIGVIAFQIATLPNAAEQKSKPVTPKADEAQPKSPPEPVMKQDEVAATVEAEPEVPVSFPTLAISEIHLPEIFQNAWLNPVKTAPVREWIRKHGKLDKPVDVTLKDGEYWLVDGYRRYALAKEEGFTEIPVQIVIED